MLENVGINCLVVERKMSLFSPPSPPALLSSLNVFYSMGEFLTQLKSPSFFFINLSLEVCTISSNFMGGVLHFNITLSQLFRSDKRLGFVSSFHYLSQDTF